MKRELKLYRSEQVIAPATKPEATVRFDGEQISVECADAWMKLILSAHFDASSPGLARVPIDGHALVSLAPGTEQHFNERVNDLFRIGFRAVA
jgi:hypothetical protein